MVIHAQANPAGRYRSGGEIFFSLQEAIWEVMRPQIAAILDIAEEGFVAFRVANRNQPSFAYQTQHLNPSDLARAMMAMEKMYYWNLGAENPVLPPEWVPDGIMWGDAVTLPWVNNGPVISKHYVQAQQAEKPPQAQDKTAANGIAFSMMLPSLTTLDRGLELAGQLLQNLQDKATMQRLGQPVPDSAVQRLEQAVSDAQHYQLQQQLDPHAVRIHRKLDDMAYQSSDRAASVTEALAAFHQQCAMQAQTAPHLELFSPSQLERAQRQVMQGMLYVLKPVLARHSHLPADAWQLEEGLPMRISLHASSLRGQDIGQVGKVLREASQQDTSALTAIRGLVGKNISFPSFIQDGQTVGSWIIQQQDGRLGWHMEQGTDDRLLTLELSHTHTVSQLAETARELYQALQPLADLRSHYGIGEQHWHYLQQAIAHLAQLGELQQIQDVTRYLQEQIEVAELAGHPLAREQHLELASLYEAMAETYRENALALAESAQQEAEQISTPGLAA